MLIILLFKTFFFLQNFCSNICNILGHELINFQNLPIQVFSKGLGKFFNYNFDFPSIFLFF